MPETVLLTLKPTVTAAKHRAEFAAVEVHAPAGTLALAGPGATLDRDYDEVAGPGTLNFARRIIVPYSHFEPGQGGGEDTYEVTPAGAANLVNLLGALRWHLEEAPEPLESAWAGGTPITAAMLEAAPPEAPKPPPTPTPPAPRPADTPPANPAQPDEEATKP